MDVISVAPLVLTNRPSTTARVVQVRERGVTGRLRETYVDAGHARQIGIEERRGEDDTTYLLVVPGSDGRKLRYKAGTSGVRAHETLALVRAALGPAPRT